MDHFEVVERTRQWLLGNYPQDTYVAEKVVGAYGPDWYVKSIDTAEPRPEIVQVECKASDDKADHAIGQCLGYLATFGAPIFLAIPVDFIERNHLEKVIETLRLPINLLIVSESEVVKKEFP